MAFQNVFFDESVPTYINDNSFFISPDNSENFADQDDKKKKNITKGFNTKWSMTSNFTLNFTVSFNS